VSRNIYSSQFIVWGPGNPNAAFAVPEGYTAVVRFITVWAFAGGDAATIGFQNSTAAPVCWFAYLQVVGVNQTLSWDGHVVVPGGGRIELNNSKISPNASVYVGGYLFANSSSSPPLP
jgi:hypothetical protein